MYTSLVATSLSISTYLRHRLESATTLGQLFDPVQAGTCVVSLPTPEAMISAPTQGLSIWLYRITRDPDLLNDPPIRLNPAGYRQAPVPVRLHYLFTPIVGAATANNAETEQRILGKVLQSLYDHAVFGGADLAGDFSGTSTVLRARLEPMTLEELTRIWNALEEPYRLSTSYEVPVPLIDSDIVEQNTPVTDVIGDYGVIVEEA